MNKKTKKQIDILRTRLQKLQQRLAGAKKQCDDPAEIVQLEKDIASTMADLERLKNA